MAGLLLLMRKCTYFPWLSLCFGKNESQIVELASFYNTEKKSMLQYIFERKLLLVIKTVFCFFCVTNDTDSISRTQFSPASVQTLEKGIWTNGIFVSSIRLVAKMYNM